MAFAPRYVAPSLAGVYMPPAMAPFEKPHYQRNGLRGLGKVTAPVSTAKTDAKAAAKTAAKESAKVAAQAAAGTATQLLPQMMAMLVQAARDAGASEARIAALPELLRPVVLPQIFDPAAVQAVFAAVLQQDGLSLPPDFQARLNQVYGVVPGAADEVKRVQEQSAGTSSKTMLYVGGALLLGVLLLAARK